MTLKDKIKQQPFSVESSDVDSCKQYYLVLHNDDVNTFEHVIECLIKICRHDMVQAEQCAYITHYNGKCEIKKGYYGELNYLKNLMHAKGLSVTLD